MRRLTIATLAALLLAVFVILLRDRPAAPVDASASDPSGDHAQDREPSDDERRTRSDPQPLPPVLIDPQIRIEKSRRALTVLSDGVAVKSYLVALGREPAGDKEREGDGRTPEGSLYVCTKNPESRYHRALGLSYPSVDDADRGLAQGLISRRERRVIVEAIHRFRQPPWNTGLGGEIMIHGGGAHADWTDGCIALADTEARELFDALPLGTPVTIVP